MPQNVVISASKISKQYRDVRALDGVDLEVNHGEIYAFVGLNGAGKTTTIRILLGLIRPTQGGVTLFGRQIGPQNRGVLRRVGYLVETATSYPNLTVAENLHIQRRLLNVPESFVGEVVELLGLTRSTNRQAGNLSLGNKQRLAIARAVLHKPDLLILDEPVNALDPAGIVEVRRLLRHLADTNGTTIFLSSHLLSEVSQIADRVGIIHEGRMIDEVSREEIHRRFRGRLEVDVSETKRATELLRERLEIGDIQLVGDKRLRLPLTAERASEVAKVLVMGGVEIFRLCYVEEDLEGYFLRRTGKAQ